MRRAYRRETSATMSRRGCWPRHATQRTTTVSIRDADVRTLKLIRVLRTLDMPVEDIRAVLSGTLPLTEAAERQRRQLEAEQQKLAAAAAFCTGWP